MITEPSPVLYDARFVIALAPNVAEPLYRPVEVATLVAVEVINEPPPPPE